MKKDGKFKLIFIVALFCIAFSTLCNVKIINADEDSNLVTYHGTINGRVESYPHATVGGVLGGIDYEGNGHYPNWGNPTGSWFDFNRFGSWNTKEDGSGTYFRGGQVLNEEDVRIIKENGGNLYQQWANMLSFLNFSINPKVSLNGSNQHINEKTAFVTDKGEYLNYSATLDYESIRKELSVLWGRIDKIESSSGYMNLYFDGRLEFDHNVDVFFASNWLKPTSFENAKEDVVEGVSGYTFTFNTSNLEKTTVKNIRGENVDAWTAKIPISMVDKSIIGTMSFDKFMEPMVLTVKDNYANGVASLVSETSFNDVALSENPFIETGGNISLTVTGSMYGIGTQQQTLTGNATPQIAKIYPTGHYEIEYRNIEDNSEVNTITYPKTTEYGRYQHPKLSDTDINNKSENYNIDIPSSITDLSDNEQYFVKYTVNTDDSTETGYTDSKISSVYGATPIKYIAWYSKQNLSEKYSISGTKTWNDNENQAGKRPDSITVNLLADGVKVDTKKVTAADNWQYDFTDLPKFKDGKEIVYTVTENAVENYISKIDGFNITNIYKIDNPSDPSDPSINTSDKKLPKTGEQRTATLIVLGLSILLSTVGYSYVQNKNNI